MGGVRGQGSPRKALQVRPVWIVPSGQVMEEAAWPISTWSASQGSTGLEAYKLTGEKAGLCPPRTVADSPWKPSATPWSDLSHRQEVSSAIPCTLSNTEAQKSPLQFM